MKKLICLEDAIDAIERKKDKNAKGDIGGFYNKIIQNDIDTLMQLPSAEPRIIRCKDCSKRHDEEGECPMLFIESVTYDDDGYIEVDDILHDNTEDEGFCHMGERRTDENTDIP